MRYGAIEITAIIIKYDYPVMKGMDPQNTGPPHRDYVVQSDVLRKLRPISFDLWRGRFSSLGGSDSVQQMANATSESTLAV